MEKVIFQYLIVPLTTIIIFSMPAFGQGFSAQGLSQEPEVVEQFNRAKGYYDDGEYMLAIKVFQAFVDNNPHHPFGPQASLYLGQALMNQLEFGRAIGSYLKSLKLYSDSPYRSGLRRGLAMAYFEIRKMDKAIPLLEMEIELEEDEEGRKGLEEKLLDAYIGGRFYLEAVQLLSEQINRMSELEEQDLIMDKIRFVMDHGLNEKELLKILDQFPGQFPSDIVLFKLLEIYKSHEDVYRQQNVIEQLIADFPDHSYHEQLQALEISLEGRLREKEFVIGALLPLTGPLRPYAISILNGLQLALSSSALKGYDVGLKVIDTEGDIQKIQSGMRLLVNNFNTIAVVGPLLSKGVESLVPQVERFRVPLITPTATRENLTGLSSYVFRNSLTHTMQARSLADYSTEKLGLKHFVILYPNDRYGINLARFFAREILKKGKELIFIDSYEPEVRDFKKLLQKLKKADLKRYGIEEEIEIPRYPKEDVEIDNKKIQDGNMPQSKIKELVYLQGFDAIFLPGTVQQIGLLAPQLAFHGFLRSTLVGSNGWNSEDLVKIGGKYVEGSIFVDSFIIDYSKPLVREFTNRFRSRFQSDPDVFSALAYDCGQMIIQGIEMGADSGASMRDTLAEIEGFTGVSGNTTVSENGDMIKEPVFLTVKNGKISPIQ